ncbi:hypothetical protein ACIQXG_21325 [Lysinibacillus sphaericus]
MYGLKRVNKQWKDGNVERISKNYEQSIDLMVSAKNAEGLPILIIVTA